jgi:hypothetical protein
MLLLDWPLISAAGTLQTATVSLLGRLPGCRAAAASNIRERDAIAPGLLARSSTASIDRGRHSQRPMQNQQQAQPSA